MDNIAELAKKLSGQYGIKIDPVSILVTGFTSFAGALDNGKIFFVTYVPDKFMLFTTEVSNPEHEVKNVLDKLVEAINGLKPFIKYQETNTTSELNTYEWDWEDVQKRVRELEALVEKGDKKNLELL